MNRALSTFAILAVAATPVAAQEIFQLDEITVFANRDETMTSRSGASVIVIDQADLEQAGSIKLADYLSRLPGVSISANGPLGTSSNLRIRGADGKYVAVYVDGIKVTDPSSTQVYFDFGTLTTADIGRVEILKGSQSALYGGSAVGGVINITTKRAAVDGVSQSAMAEYGSYNTRIGRFTFANRSENGELSFSLSRTASDGFSAADENDGNTEADGFDQKRVSVSGRYHVTDALTLGASMFYEESDSQYDEFDFGSGSYVDGTPDEEQQTTSKGARIFAELSTGAIDHLFSLEAFHIDRVYSEGSAFGPANYSYQGRRTALSYQGSTALNDRTDVVFGLDHNIENFDQFGDFGTADTTSRISGAYAQLLFAPTEAIDISATVRGDDHSAFGTFTTGRLAAVYRPAEDLLFRATAATGFRAPSNYELFGPYGFSGLVPEESTSFELGVEKQYGNSAYVRATAFYLETRHEIGFGTATYVTSNDTTIRKGVELEGAYAVSDRVNLTGAYTYTNAKASDGSRLARVPMHDLSIGVDVDVTERLSASATIQHVAGVQEWGDLPDYTVANATFTYDVTDTAQAYLRVENLFDEEYQTARGYGTSDRAFYVGLRADF